MLWKQFLKDYLLTSRKERIGVITILGVLAILYFLPRLFAKPSTALTLKSDPAVQIASDSLKVRNQKNFQFRDYEREDYASQLEPQKGKGFTEGELFMFDPNTISTEGWQKLGLNEKTAKTISNYRNKGGKFYKPEDLMRVWGMPEGFYERVKNHISIAGIKRKYSQDNFTKSDYEKKERRFTVININEADTTALIELPGIGSKLAFRIANFRDKLGGFYSIDQVKETYGLPDSTFQKIKPFLQISGVVKKININTASKDELKVHPYIKWNLANAIVEYRNQQGKFASLEDLKKIILIDDAVFRKIQPYLIID